MLAEAGGVKKIIIACGRTDLRKGIDGLAQLIGTKYDLNPFEKDVLFLFCGSRVTASADYSGKEMDFCFFISVLRMVLFPGRVIHRKRRS